MITRRALLAAAPFAALVPAAPPAHAAGRFDAFVALLRAESARAGVSAAVFDAAFRGVQPNPKVLELDRHQPEFTLTWAEYKARVLPPPRLDAGRQAYAANARLLEAVTRAYPADPRIVVGIWGLESRFGERTGSFGIVESLATLAYDGRRAGYFRSELINALRILEAGDVTPRAMTGSWAGAMGQPQFMPSSFLRYAVDFDRDGRRDIWADRSDVFASIANYLARCGWRPGEPWGQPVRVPPGLDPTATGRDAPRSLAAWEAVGVRRIDGRRFSRPDVSGALVLPDGPGGEAFMTYANFRVIRRYNPSDFYALAVGLLGNAAA
jgi:membrane-bound lytic murein transglycosylase B